MPSHPEGVQAPAARHRLHAGAERGGHRRRRQPALRARRNAADHDLLHQRRHRRDHRRGGTPRRGVRRSAVSGAGLLSEGRVAAAGHSQCRRRRVHAGAGGGPVHAGDQARGRIRAGLPQERDRRDLVLGGSGLPERMAVPGAAGPGGRPAGRAAGQRHDRRRHHGDHPVADPGSSRPVEAADDGAQHRCDSRRGPVRGRAGFAARLERGRHDAAARRLRGGDPRAQGRGGSVRRRPRARLGAEPAPARVGRESGELEFVAAFGSGNLEDEIATLDEPDASTAGEEPPCACCGTTRRRSATRSTARPRS